MDSAELKHIERRARIGYEWGRARRALLGFAPALGVVLIAMRIGERPHTILALGLLMFAAGVLALWYGRGFHRGVLPGFLAGIVPLSLAVCAKRVGHVCAGDHCATLCLPACVAGGLIAGVALALVGRRVRRGAPYWISVSAVALLTGAMGCTCVGYFGLAGLGVGYATGILSVAARWSFRRSSA